LRNSANKQNNELTNADENITFLAVVTNTGTFVIYDLFILHCNNCSVVQHAQVSTGK